MSIEMSKHTEKKLRHRLDTFHQLFLEQRVRGKMNTPAICWCWMRVYEARFSIDELIALYEHVTRWGEGGGFNPLYKAYVEFVKSQPYWDRLCPTCNRKVMTDSEAALGECLGCDHVRGEVQDESSLAFEGDEFSEEDGG